MPDRSPAGPRAPVDVSQAGPPPAAVGTPDDPRPQPPEAPLPSDCCDSGCDPCVYDLYNDELQLYRQRLAQWQERHPHAD